MSHLALSGLIKALGGTGQVTGFFLVLARVTPLFLLAPLFSSKMMPVRVRGIIAVALSIGLTPMALHGQTIPSSPMGVAGSIIVQVLVGLAFAFAVGAVFAAVEAAGHLVDNASGLSFGATVDPINGNAGGTFASLYGLVGTAIFIAIGGDAWTLRGLSRTFALVPLGKSPQISALVAGAQSAFAGILVSALEVAAPVILALLVSWGLLALGKASIVALLAGIVVLDLGVQGLHISNQSAIYALRGEARSRLTTAYMVAYFLGGTVLSAATSALYAGAGWEAVCALGAGTSAVALAAWVATESARPAAPVTQRA